MEDSRPSLLKRQLLVDRNMQMPLILYSLLMTFIGVVASSFFSVIWAYAVQLRLSSSISLIILAFTIFSSICLIFFAGLYFTNKVAGPLYRLKHHILAIQSGRDPGPLFHRHGDLVMSELIDNYNKLVEPIRKNLSSEDSTSPK